MNFTKETQEYINKVSLDDRKDKGQYFTHRSTQKEIFNNLPSRLYNIENINILDPSSGTGEFLLSCKEKFNQPNLYGWEIDEELINISKEVIPEATFKNVDSLTYSTNKEFDLIIGNPPYYEFSPTEEIKNIYGEILYGRTNIYELFIYKSIKLLREGGYIGFILSPSMKNGAYFKKLRQYIIDKCNIKYMNVLDDSNLFEGADQSVMALILKKGKSKENSYIFKKGSKTIFTEDYRYLRNEFKNKKNLKELGYNVKTGSIEWNNNRDILTNKSNNPILIWSHNIKNCKLKTKINNRKPQYIKHENPNEGPAIVVKRVIGKPGKGNIKAAKIESNQKFLAENHVNVILPPDNTNKKEINSILDQLNEKETTEVVQKLTGNTQLSKTELLELVPLKFS